VSVNDTHPIDYDKMTQMHKEDILAEMKRTAEENGGKPLGVARFEQATGIRPYDWQKYWARFGDAQREAGFEPNKLVASLPDDYLLEKVATLTRKLKKFPTSLEMRIEKRHSDPDFPNDKGYERFGNKSQFVARVAEYCRDHTEYADVATLLEPFVAKQASTLEARSPNDTTEVYGFVYLVKGHPGEYKIGRTNLVDRRLSELGATASIEQELIHEIKTDDPSGLEVYWHRRFQEKRMRGEWFKLTAADIRAFKRWKHIY
jgi:hypothetical protein